MAKGVKVSSDGTTLEVIAPKHAAGPVNVTITTKDGSFTYSLGYEYVQGAKTSTSYIIFGGDSSVLTARAKASLAKLVKSIPKSAKVLSVSINGWVKRTPSKAIDAKLSKARAVVTGRYLKGLRLGGKYVLSGKGIYHLGNDKDRRAEIEITWLPAGAPG